MAGSVNKVILIGNLGKDPEIRTLNSGDRVANLRIATSETWRDKASGERKEKTEWHQVVIFNENLVKVAESYLRKGSKVYVEGQLQTEHLRRGHALDEAAELGGVGPLPRGTEQVAVGEHEPAGDAAQGVECSLAVVDGLQPVRPVDRGGDAGVDRLDC